MTEESSPNEFTVVVGFKSDDNIYVRGEVDVQLEDGSGFTEEQLGLLLEEQLRLTLNGIASIEGVSTELPEYVP